MPSSKKVLIATEPADRLDRWLHDHFPEYSRSGWQRLIREKRVLLHGEIGTSKSTVSVGDPIEIELPPPLPSTLEPEAVPLDILYEDDHLLVLNKPPGMVVHPGAGHRDHTLVHALLHHCHGQLSGIGGEERPGIVHRLDKDTSGCLVVAKTETAHRQLVASFQSRSVEKIYLALVWGSPRMLSGRIEKPIGRHPVHRNRMTIRPEGRPARTDWKIREALGKISLLECQIHTGRTHQIRVHLASIGHPVIGDPLYGRSRDVALHALAKRQMLHAWRLTFAHPVEHRSLSCEAPVPHDMQQLIQQAARFSSPG